MMTVAAPPVVQQAQTYAAPPAMQTTARAVGAPVQGRTTQMKVGGAALMMHDQAVVTQHQSSIEATMERAPPQQVAGITYEENRPAVHTSVHQEQLVAGPVQQNVVEIPTVQEVVTYQDIPEMQVREMVQEVPQVVTYQDIPEMQVREMV